MLNSTTNKSLCEKWEPILEGITDESTRQMTAVLLENQAKSILTENSQGTGTLEEATTVGNLGTFQKFAFPLVRRVFPELIANKICGVQPMQGPVSQIFYLGYNRAGRDSNGTASSDVVYSKFRMIYAGRMGQAQNNLGSLDVAAAAPNGSDGWSNLSGLSGLDSAGNARTDSLAIASGNLNMSAMTAGSRIANFPNSGIAGPQYFVSAGEHIAGSSIPEVNFTIEQQSVTARTRKFRALWTLEASQDLRAYHNLDLERELTELLSKEVALEIDREIVESIRTLAYGYAPNSLNGNDWWNWTNGGNSNDFGNSQLPPGAGPSPANGGEQGSFSYDQPQGTNSNDSYVPNEYGLGSARDGLTMPTGAELGSNVFFVDFGTTALGLAPRHVGEVYANLVAVVNFASQDIYKTTMRSAANYIVCSPFIAAMLQSAAKLEGGISPDQAGSLGASIEFKGKWMGQYDVYVDPLYPEDELLLGYKGASPMDAGFVYAPYIPLQMLPTITDPQTFQPRKGLITRYATAQINPSSRFYRIIRIVGADSRYLTTPFMKASSLGTKYTAY